MAKLPQFADEKEEAEFWATHDSTEYLGEIKPVEVSFVDARIPKKLISVRFDNETIESLKAVARTKGIGYQTLIRLWVNERLAQEQTGKVS
jgi:predicted DNA binding CopG/RHH family protein